MTRTILANGRIFDGTGAAVADGDPLDAIGLSERIEAVYTDGERVVDRSE